MRQVASFTPRPLPYPPCLMSPEEFERLKNEEKAHLRKLRDLKGQHRDAQRKASSLEALNKMRNTKLEADVDAGTDKLMRDAALSEARFDLALEGQAAQTNEETDAADLAKAEAEALVRQMRAQMGGGAMSSETAPQAAKDPAAPQPAAPVEDKTIGRTPPPDDESPPAPRGDKSIGRRRDP